MSTIDMSYAYGTLPDSVKKRVDRAAVTAAISLGLNLIALAVASGITNLLGGGDASATVFVWVCLWRYTRFIVNCIGWCLYRPATGTSLTAKNVTVILPTIDPMGPDFDRCLRTCAENSPKRIIVVTAGEALYGLTTAAVNPVRAAFSNVQFSVTYTQIASKREQVARAIPMVDTELTLMLDDHVFWGPRFLESALRPFKDESVGLVGTNKSVERAPGLSVWNRIWNVLGSLYLIRHNFEIRATNAIDGGVFVVSARTCIIRTTIIQSPQFTHGYKNELFFVVRQGREIKIQYTPDAGIETTVGVAQPVAKKFLGQCRRWARTTFRSNVCSLVADRSVWSYQPWTVYAVFLTSFTNFALITDLTLYFSLSWSRWGGATVYGMPIQYLLVMWILFTKLVKVFPYFWQYPRDAAYFLAYLSFAYYHSLIKLFALFTFWDCQWTGRNLQAIAAESGGDNGSDDEDLSNLPPLPPSRSGSSVPPTRQGSPRPPASGFNTPPPDPNTRTPTPPPETNPTVRPGDSVPASPYPPLRNIEDALQYYTDHMAVLRNTHQSAGDARQDVEKRLRATLKINDKLDSVIPEFNEILNATQLSGLQERAVNARLQETIAALERIRDTLPEAGASGDLRLSEALLRQHNQMNSPEDRSRTYSDASLQTLLQEFQKRLSPARPTSPPRTPPRSPSSSSATRPQARSPKGQEPERLVSLRRGSVSGDSSTTTTASDDTRIKRHNALFAVSESSHGTKPEGKSKEHSSKGPEAKTPETRTRGESPKLSTPITATKSTPITAVNLNRLPGRLPLPAGSVSGDSSTTTSTSSSEDPRIKRHNALFAVSDSGSERGSAGVSPKRGSQGEKISKAGNEAGGKSSLSSPQAAKLNTMQQRLRSLRAGSVSGDSSTTATSDDSRIKRHNALFAVSESSYGAGPEDGSLEDPFSKTPEAMSPEANTKGESSGCDPRAPTRKNSSPARSSRPRTAPQEPTTETGAEGESSTPPRTAARPTTRPRRPSEPCPVPELTEAGAKGEESSTAPQQPAARRLSLLKNPGSRRLSLSRITLGTTGCEARGEFSKAQALAEVGLGISRSR